MSAAVQPGVAQDSRLLSTFFPFSWPMVLERVPGGSSLRGITRILGYTPVQPVQHTSSDG